MVSADKKAKTSEAKPRLSALERARIRLAEAEKKEADRAAKIIGADKLVYARAKVAADKAAEKLAAAVTTLTSVHKLSDEDIAGIDVTKVIAEAPVPKPRAKVAEATEVL